MDYRIWWCGETTTLLASSRKHGIDMLIDFAHYHILVSFSCVHKLSIMFVALPSEYHIQILWLESVFGEVWRFARVISSRARACTMHIDQSYLIVRPSVHHNVFFGRVSIANCNFAVSNAHNFTDFLQYHHKAFEYRQKRNSSNHWQSPWRNL